MKNANKLLAVLLVMMMTLALAVPAFAAGTCDVTYTDGTNSKIITNSTSPYTLLAFDATDLSSDLVLPTGKTFYKWEIDGKLYAAGESVELTGAVTATAIYQYKNTLTINGAKSNHEFSAYQIFAGTIDEDELKNIVWGSNFNPSNTAALVSALKTAFGSNTTITALGSDSTPAAIAAAIGTISDAEDAKKLAEVFNTYVSGTPTRSIGTTSPYIITGLDDGYYFVKDAITGTPDPNDVVSDFILKLVKTTSVNIKGDIPTVDKKVKAPGAANYEDGGTTSPVKVQVGDILDYEIIGTLPSNYADYATYKMVFKDTADKDLKLKSGTCKVYVDVEGTGTTLTEVGSGVTSIVFGTTGSPAKDTLTVTINDAKSLYDTAATPALISTTSASKIIVKYQAEVLSTTTANVPDVNEAYLEYSNNPHSTGTGETGPDYVKTVTQSFKLVKYDGADNKLLAGATFELQISGTAIELVKESATLYHIADSTETGTVSSFTTSDLTSAITITGLAEGVTYTLHEVTAPAGYNVAADFDFTVSAATTIGTAVITGGVYDDASSSCIFAIENNSGSKLPETGGMGTVIFITVGVVLVMTAGIVLTTKKRMYNEG